MATVLGSAPPRSLCSIAPGEIVRIGTIPLDAVRAVLSERGIEVGQQVMCRVAGPDWLILEVLTENGSRRVVLERDRARLIDVE